MTMLPNSDPAEMYKCTLIGISDSREQWFPPHVAGIIAQGKVFSGGRRHREIMAPYLPAESAWIDITVPLNAVFEQYEAHPEVVIFASGDPLFYGFAATVQRLCPQVQMHVFPAFNSLQMLAHRLLLPYQDMHAVSLTGRPWEGLDRALIRGERLIGCLTDGRHTPQAIWQRMQDYGYSNYRLYVGECLGNEQERVGLFDPEKEYAQPNCVLLQQMEPRRIPFGLPEKDFHLLDGREKMITKMPIRLCTLSALNLPQAHHFWDIGFCTGSISIEARLRFPHLSITAFEIREQGAELMEKNARRFGAPGICPVIGDFMQLDLSPYEAPDAVFIGGHGGKLVEIIQRIHSVMAPGGCIVFNSVSPQSREQFMEGTRQAGLTCTEVMHLTVDEHNPITILKAQ